LGAARSRVSSEKLSGKGKGTGGRAYVVFISYSSRDAFVASTLRGRVESAGAAVWLDRKDMEGGDVVLERIREGIDSCDEAIVLVSPYSRQSQWVTFEIGALWGQRKRVTPILIHTEPGAIQPFQGIQAIDLNDFEEFEEQLKNRIGKASR
jgi:predicted nucleotide-binding protein